MHATVHCIGALEVIVDVLRSHATHAEFVFCRAGSFCTVQVCAPGLEVRVSFALIIILSHFFFLFLHPGNGSRTHRPRKLSITHQKH